MDMKNSKKTFTQGLLLPIAFFALTIFNACREDAESVEPFVPLVWPQIAFTKKADTVSENSPSGIVVQLSLSEAPPFSVDLIVEGPYCYDYFKDGRVYGNVCVTKPEMVVGFDEDYIPLSVNKDSAIVEFTVLPINNTMTNPNYELVFSVRSTSGWFRANDHYKLTVVDDD
jgi:hypothetical protein